MKVHSGNLPLLANYSVTPFCHAATMTCPVPTQTASCCPGRVAAISRYTHKVILALPHYGAPGSPRVRRELLHA